MQKTDVAIIGGGASGALVALSLVRDGAVERVTWIGRREGRFGRGLGWASGLDERLSHEPAASLSVDEDAPERFVSFAMERGALDEGFAPRRLWGAYLDESLRAATRASATALVSVEGSAVGLSLAGERWRVSLEDGQHVDASQVVLATGHERAVAPEPWGADARAAGLLTDALFDPLPQPRDAAPILLLGAGLAMVDAALSLASTAGRALVAVSPEGWTPTVHRPTPPWELGRAPPLGSLSALRQWLRGELFEAALAQVSWRAVLDRLRPRTPALWAALPLAERQRFLRHGRVLWEVHRHRMAPRSARALAGLRLGKALDVVAGRLEDVSVAAGQLRARLDGKRHVFSAVVDCRGPSCRVQHTANPLLRSALASGHVEPHPVGLGVRASPSLAVVAAGRRVPGLFALGPLLTGERWETTELVELRTQARVLADQLSGAGEASEPVGAPLTP